MTGALKLLSREPSLLSRTVLMMPPFPARAVIHKCPKQSTCAVRYGAPRKLGVLELGAQELRVGHAEGGGPRNSSGPDRYAQQNERQSAANSQAETSFHRFLHVIINKPGKDWTDLHY